MILINQDDVNRIVVDILPYYNKSVLESRNKYDAKVAYTSYVIGAVLSYLINVKGVDIFCD